MKKRILIADSIATDGVEYLRSQPDFDVEVRPGLDESGLGAIVAPFHAVIVRSATRITAKIMDCATSLQVIGRAGIGVDNIDVARATERGIAVLNTPDANATTTAELTLAHIMSLSRSLPQADRSVRAGEWKRSDFMGAELAHKRLGVVGYGTIGRIVAARARALEMQVAAHDPFVTDEVFASTGVESMDIDELVTVSDYLTLHCPLNDKTRGILNAARIASMKPGARLINCARGGLVDERALHEALASGRLGGAALDVFEHEPPAGSPLLKLDNVVVTPHLGASTHEAQAAAGREIARQVAVYLRTGEPINAINLPPVGAGEMAKLLPYLTLVRRLGALLGPMVQEPIRQLDVTLAGDAAERDMRSLVIESLVGLLGMHMSVPVNRVNARHVAAQQGIALVESRREQHPDYHGTVSLAAHHGNRTTTVEGTLFDRRHPRLVRINDYEIEAVLDGHLLLTRHRDQPGVIAAISSLLAGRGINISRMQLGIVNGSDKAVAVIGVSTPLDAELLRQLAAVPAISKVMQVSL
ncbi:MAG TPA: phosphoglycerate dehydrogenase [Gammaproteobacteria bacterium]